MIPLSRVFHVDVLSILFGLGTWLCVNGLWVELPLLVQKLPEGWNLPSYLSVVVQMSNLGPLLYTLLNSLFPRHVTENRSIYFVMVIGLISTLLLANFWEKTTFIAGDNHSTALLILVFFLASVDCSSRVLYLPFMAKFQEIYLTSYFIGEGLSGFVPSIVALAQGVGGNPECRNTTDGNGTEPYSPDPRFSIDVFFYFLFAFTLLSALAFYLLGNDSIIKDAKNSISRLSSSSNSKSTSSREGSYAEHSVFELPNVPNDSNVNINSSLPLSNQYNNLRTVEDSSGRENSLLLGLSQKTFIYLLVLLAYVCFLSNGVFPSIQSYSCLPYGNVAYHLAVTLSNMANPAVCFLSFFIPPPTKNSVTIAAVLSTLVSGFVLFTAVESPTPPLSGESIGEVLLVISWIVLVGLFTYVKVSIAGILRTIGKSGLFWCGAVTQFGSTIGALLAFFIVNYTSIFVPYYPCT